MRQRTPALALGALLAMLGLTSCAAQAGPASLPPSDGSETTICTPAAAGEEFLAGDVLLLERTDSVVIEDVSFESAEGAALGDAFLTTTADGHGYYLYPQADLRDEAPDAWNERLPIPTTGDLPAVADRTLVLVGVVRSGEGDGRLTNLRVTYTADSRSYETSNTLTYVLSAAPCD